MKRTKRKTYDKASLHLGRVDVLSLKNQWMQFELRSPMCLVGSGEDCDIRIIRKDVPPELYRIEVNIEKQAFLVRLSEECDLFLNGEAVLYGKPYCLKNGNIIRVGPKIMKYVDPEHSFPGTAHFMEPERLKRVKPEAVAFDYIAKKEDQQGLEDRWINSEIGWGVFATKGFLQGQFLLEYPGKTLKGVAATTTADTNYTYHFKFKGEHMCIDATEKPSSGPFLGRLVNHGDHPSQRNAVMKRVTYDNEPHLCLFSTRKIDPGEEILYDYGVKNLPWQKGKTKVKKRKRKTGQPFMSKKTSVGEKSESDSTISDSVLMSKQKNAGRRFADETNLTKPKRKAGKPVLAALSTKAPADFDGISVGHHEAIRVEQKSSGKLATNHKRKTSTTFAENVTKAKPGASEFLVNQKMSGKLATNQKRKTRTTFAENVTVTKKARSFKAKLNQPEDFEVVVNEKSSGSDESTTRKPKRQRMISGKILEETSANKGPPGLLSTDLTVDLKVLSTQHIPGKLATNQKRKTRKTFAENVTKKARSLKAKPNLPGHSEVLVNQKMSDSGVSIARISERQSMKSGRILQETSANKGASCLTSTDLPVDLKVLSKQHTLGKLAKNQKRKTRTTLAKNARKKARSLKAKPNLSGDLEVVSNQTTSDSRVSTARKLPNQSMISGQILEEASANKPSSGLTSSHLPVHLEVMPKQHKAGHHVPAARKSQKQSMKSGQVLEEAASIIATSCLTPVDLPVDLEVMSEQHKTGHHVPAARKPQKQSMKSGQVLEEAASIIATSCLTPVDLPVDLEVMSEQHKTGPVIYNSGNVPKHMTGSFVLLKDISNAVPKKKSPEFQATLYVPPEWTQEWTTEHTETENGRWNGFQKQHMKDGPGQSELIDSEVFRAVHLTPREADSLVSKFLALEENSYALTPGERQNLNKNIKYAYDVLFGSVSNDRLQQARKVNTIYGPHYVQGDTNYCGYCCVSNALSEFSQEIVTIKEMDTIADKLWFQMVDNPSLGLLTELEPMRDIEGFYSVEVIRFTLEAHGYEMNRIDDRALTGLSPAESGQYVISSLQEQLGIVSLIIRQRHHMHWINVSFQDYTPLLKDSQKTKAIPITIVQLGELILNNLAHPGGVFFLSKDVTPGAQILAEELTTVNRSDKAYESIQEKKAALHLSRDVEPSVSDKTLFSKNQRQDKRSLRRSKRCPSLTTGEKLSIDEDTDHDDSDYDPDYVVSGEDYHSTDEEANNVGDFSENDSKDEESFDRDQNGRVREEEEFNHEISVPTTTAYVNGKRVVDKTHCCYFCKKYYARMPRHFKTHKEYKEIKELNLKTGKDRLKELDRLRLKGDFMHNISVRGKNDGFLIVVRRPSDGTREYTSDDFGPCVHCKGFFVRWELWRHEKKCKFAPSTEKKKRNRPQQNSVILLESTKPKPIQDESFIRNVISRMTVDDVSLAVRNDTIALKYGELKFSHFAKSKERKLSVSSDLRLLGRLVLEMRQVTGITDGYLKDFMKCEHFDQLIVAACTLASMDETGVAATFKKPTVGQKIGRLLTKLCGVLEGQASRNDDDDGEKNARRMRTLIEHEWGYKVNAIASKTLEENRRQKPILLPTTEDLIKVKDYLEIELEKRQNRLETDISMENFQEFQSVVLCRLIMFNRLRSGEAAEVRLSDYLTRPDWHAAINREIYNSLPGLERELSKTNDMIMIRGKRKPVTLILLPEIQAALDLLVKCRPTVGILPDNIYLFPRTMGEDHINGCATLSDEVKNVEGVEFPDRICSTNLRKYIATVVQVMNLSDMELEWLTNHLGHSIKIHKDFYRNQTPTIELGHVAKLLLAIDRGFSLKQAEEATADLCAADDEVAEEGTGADDETVAEEGTGTNTEEEIIAAVEFETNKSTDEDESSTDDEKNTERVPNDIVKRGKRRRVHTKSTPWTEDENRAILRQLSNWIYFERKAPNKEACERAQQAEPVLQSRSWSIIKWKVHNLIQAEKRKIKIK